MGNIVSTRRNFKEGRNKIETLMKYEQDGRYLAARDVGRRKTA